MFKKITSIPYKIVYRFRTRTDNPDRDAGDGLNDFVVKDALTGSDIEKYTEFVSGAYTLGNNLIIEKSPMESNYGETLYWSDANIQKSISDSGELTAVVTAIQNKETATVNYRLGSSGVYTTIKTEIGANRENDSRLAELDLRGTDSFSYWEIRKSENGNVIAKCYDSWFSFCIMGDCWITPVFEGSAVPDEQLITLTHLGYSRNRWTDEDGKLYPKGDTDLLYTDFEIAFTDGTTDLFGQDSGYRVGVVFELCAAKQEPFVQGTDYQYQSDFTNLEAAIKSGASYYRYSGDKRRSVQVSSISTGKLTNKNRIEFGKSFNNSYKEDSSGKKTYGNW